jgi:parallel beta-helix repeat protein
MSTLSVLAGFGFMLAPPLQTLATSDTTITISDDASGGDCRDIGGNWNPNRKQCILRSDINGHIVIASNDITLNCANREIIREGEAAEHGILLSGVSGVTIRNCKVSGFTFGIFLGNGASNNLIVGNTATNNGNGISAQIGTDNNIMRGNTASNNQFSGIFIRVADNNIIENNRVDDNGLQGIRLRESADNNVVRFNTARGNGGDDFPGDGFAVLPPSSINNEFVENESRNNGNYGFLDQTEDSGTAGTANTYTDNTCSNNDLGGSSPTGLCSPQP